jgi:hypothetical protein
MSVSLSQCPWLASWGSSNVFFVVLADCPTEHALQCDKAPCIAKGWQTHGRSNEEVCLETGRQARNLHLYGLHLHHGAQVLVVRLGAHKARL